MCSSVSAHMQYMTPHSLKQCWRHSCFRIVDPNCTLGLCPTCVHLLRESTNS
jgi:hypothetical protein